MREYELTGEQKAVIDSVGLGRTSKVIAVAGSGKTTTLREVALAFPELTFLYLVYNKAAAEDARKSFPGNVTVKTTAALAFGAYRALYEDRILGPRVPARRTAELLKLNRPFDLGDGIIFRPTSIAAMATEAVDKFCYTSDFEVSERHVVLPLGLNAIQEDALRKEIVFWAQRLWKETKLETSEHRYTFDYAFKMYVHDEPALYYDVIMLDEAQDSNEIVEYFIKQQQVQQIIVGDPAQQLYCQPVGTKVQVVLKENSGSSPAETGEVCIEDLKVGDKVVTYDNTHLWRNGREISHITRFRHDGEMVRLTTESGLKSVYTPKHHCIVRVDDNLADKHVVYAMRRGDQFRIGRTQMMYASQGKGFGVILRGRKEKADGVWILSMHDTVGQASLAEQLVQNEFNLPGVHFDPTDHDAMDVEAFWRKVGDNSEKGVRCLTSFGRLPEFPFWGPDMDQKMGIRTSIPTAAANVMDGMTVLPLRNVDDKTLKNKAPRRIWEKVKVSREYYTGDVISLEVDEHHNYFADGILTHNSWRGSVNIMERFEGDELTLSQSWRFGSAIAEEADKWLAHTGTRTKVIGNPKMDSRVSNTPLDAPSAILCRTNGGVMANAMDLREKGCKVAVAGGSSQILSFAYAAGKLMRGQPVTDRELMAFKDWSEVVAFAEEPGGKDLRPLVNMIKMHGVGGVIDLCNSLSDERRGNPDVVLSTAHKSKGREWPTVQIGDDFSPPPGVKDPFTGEFGPGPVLKADAMLAYVAVTRGRQALSRGSLKWIDDYSETVLDPW